MRKFFVLGILVVLVLGGCDKTTLSEPYDLYSKENNKVYFKCRFNCNEKVEVKNADADTFKVFKSKYDNTNIYAKDKNNVYYGGKILENADNETFKYVGEDYFKDKNYIYRWGKKIFDADVKTFEIADDTYDYAKDKNIVWYLGEKTNLSPEDFEVINVNYVKDKNGIYFKDGSTKYKKLENVDVNSFFIFSDGSDDYHGRDKNNCYSWGKIVDMSVCGELIDLFGNLNI